MWTHYKNGEREYCGNAFPDGMRKNDRLAKNVITPTTKAETHDVPISPAEIVKQVRGGAALTLQTSRAGFVSWLAKRASGSHSVPLHISCASASCVCLL